MNQALQRIIVALAALATVLGTARLGLWQLDRAAQKKALQADIVSRGEMPPLLAHDLAADATAARGQWHRRVRLEGRWLSAHTIFLDNRQMAGRPGLVVVTPLELADGSAVVVQRGWVARDFQDRTRTPRLQDPDGEIRIEGRMAPEISRLYDFGGGDAGPIRQNLDLTSYAAEVGRRLRPMAVLQSGPADDGAGLQRDWPLPASDVHKHYGYAFQWFALGTLSAALYVWFQVLRPRRRRSP